MNVNVNVNGHAEAPGITGYSILECVHSHCRKKKEIYRSLIQKPSRPREMARGYWKKWNCKNMLMTIYSNEVDCMYSKGLGLEEMVIATLTDKKLNVMELRFGQKLV